MVIECTNPQTVCERGMCRWMKKERGAERGVWTVMKSKQVTPVVNAKMVPVVVYM